MHTITYCNMISIGSDKAPVSLKWIPNVDIPYSLPKCIVFFLLTDFRKLNKKLFLNIRLNRFLYRGALTGKFYEELWRSRRVLSVEAIILHMIREPNYHSFKIIQSLKTWLKHGYLHRC